MVTNTPSSLTRSALQAMRRDIIHSPLTLEIKEQIHRTETRNIGIKLCWVPGHVNITGNEKADAAAKGSSGGNSTPYQGHPSHRHEKISERSNSRKVARRLELPY